MPRKPSKKRRRAAPEVPEWVQKYLRDRIPPEPRTADFEEFQNWYFFSHAIPGMPADWHTAPPDWDKWDRRYGRTGG